MLFGCVVVEKEVGFVVLQLLPKFGGHRRWWPPTRGAHALPLLVARGGVWGSVLIPVFSPLNCVNVVELVCEVW